MKDITEQMKDTLDWMIHDIEFRRKCSGMVPEAISPEMVIAKDLLGEMHSGTVKVFEDV